MSPALLLRAASRRTPTAFFKASYGARSRLPAATSASTPAIVALGGASGFSSTAKRCSGAHEEETFEQFSVRYEKEFDSVQDVFELQVSNPILVLHGRPCQYGRCLSNLRVIWSIQRNLNNAFAYDLVPSVAVMTAALKAARRVNDFPTAVRIFEGIKAKVENKSQYEAYLEELKPLREELGISLQEEMYPSESN
ncbi:Cytochrome c oxidase subunit 6 [Ophidiomyces ophidiicola]|uniref:Cytochrome c oxidase subunit 6 n=1 Tax=Ophidiomyces ophidiicola TaxID=1387563 RepID=A0ACB8V3V2_9EURO|nr:Cytochrome c oxidase subunit 6 [Ophidiomyces ophidiicola]KAI2012056.1 Cytochrome c oxidase subunit 6 [Ophidiomyces ophidiicola]KAI2041531.1 Cytochrome c oxidase subunit 6 [Ophidiomyces ophidiicola]KAI2057032.1 Cytochrome c oxidase subunit 6 [Ophidiomyces ophidiicola]KAI2070972.1 Cytochrome c oxidase subunit 6 [Ophidiomyces ophidiicola]